MHISPIFFISKYLFCLKPFHWNTFSHFHWVLYSGLTLFFFHFCKVSFSSHGLNNFQWEIYCESYCYSSVHSLAASKTLLHIFSNFLILYINVCMCVLTFILLGFGWASWSGRIYVLSNVKIFWWFLSSIFFYFLPPPLLSPGIHLCVH